jgi:membrane protease YdiL (CAAX protease family)
MIGAFGAVVMLVLGASILCWVVTFLRIAVGKRLLPQDAVPAALDVLKLVGTPPAPPLIDWRSRRHVTWGFIDLIAILILYLALAAVVGVALRQWTGLKIGTEMEDLTLSQRQSLTIANMAVSVLVLFIGLPLMALRPGTGLRSFGWSRATLGRDVRLGLVGFVMLAPPVYAIQGLLVYFWQPSEHPLMEMFKGAPDATFFVTLIVAAVIVAPLVEETLFRVFLQGFLEKLVSFRGAAQEVLVGRFSNTPQPIPLESVEALATPPVAALPPELNPYAPPSVLQPTAEIAVGAEIVSEDQPELRGLRSWVPIGISSIIFALLHYSHGPDWVALTLLAAGMGYLYQRTHSIVPSLTVHMCLNGLSMWGLWIQVYELKGAGM